MESVNAIDQGSLNFHPGQNLIGPFSHIHGPVFFMNPFEMLIEKYMSLLQFMDDEGLVPSMEDEIKRRNVIDKLKKIVVDWAKMIAYQRGLPKSYIAAASATILVYGSTGLGVHNFESDIDALCVGPSFATMAEDFFIVLPNMLASRPEVSDITCIKDARVPLIRFKFEGIQIDLPYFKLNTISVPENVDACNPLFLINIDEVSWRSLSGVRANNSILQLVPNIQLYQSLLRCVKLWAKRRGIYGHAQGFLGGIHLAVLAAFVCRRQLHAHLITLVFIFFQTFAFWPWPTPVVLEDGVMPLPPNNISILMPIQLPGSPNEYCYSRITRSTFYRIRQEFLDGQALTKEILWPDFDWKSLFEPFPYAKKYSHFLKIRLLCSHEDDLGRWVGKVKSRMRCLLIKLEELHGFCDPNPTEYVDVNIKEPNKVFYWGLYPARSCNINVNSIKKDFMRKINSGCEGTIGKLELEVVKASEVPKQKTNIGSKGSGRNIVCIPQYFVEYPAGSGNVGYVS